jgi:hypothetical protein
MFNKLPFAGEYDALIAPVGTSWPMAQATAPNGWTSSAITDTSLRYNSASGGASGGSANWSSWNFGSTFNVNTFTLSIAQLPAHNHTDAGHTHTDSGHAHTQNALTYYNASGSSYVGGGAGTIVSPGGQATLTSTANIQTGFASIQNTGSGSGITPTYTTPQLKYVDHILAVKS